ncbi:MAG: hypothetical protein ABI606_20080 [Rhodoferax sp.]
MKSTSAAKLVLAIAVLTTAVTAFSQSVSSDQWTPKERQFIDSARALYQQQGLSYTNEQASQAVFQMRQQSAPVQRGIPESQWTQQERRFVESTRNQYTAQGSGFTEDQARLTVQSMRDQIAKIMGTAGALQMLSQGSIPNVTSEVSSGVNQPSNNGANASSEEQIARTISTWPLKQGNLEIRGRRDGFDVNGQPFLDAEGKMFSYAFDVTTGAITYAVKTSRGLTIKALNASDIGQSIVIATGALGASGWEIQTTSGKQMAGDTLSILSNGFLVGRTSSAFRYQPGKGVRSIAIPVGFVLAPLQRGNVGATGYILLEREQATGGKDPLSQTLSSFVAIGSILGVNKKADYSLMNIETGKSYPFNIAANGKQLTLLSQCRQRNWLVSECQRAQTVESVFGEDGFKNNSHYYWLINWVGTPSGPVALSLEDGLANIYVTDLATGKKVVALNRSFGIADWEANQRSDGNVSIRAKLAFEWKEVPDVVSFLKASN